MENVLKDTLLKIESKIDKYRSDEETRAETFTKYVINKIADKMNLQDPVALHFSEKTADGNINGEIYGYNESDNGEMLTLFYTIYKETDGEGIQYLSPEERQQAYRLMQRFFERMITSGLIKDSMDAGAKEITETIYGHYENYTTIKLCIISNCASAGTEGEDGKVRIQKKNVNCVVWDLQKLHDHMDSETDHLPIDLFFGDGQDYRDYNIPFIRMKSPAFGYECILAMFPASLLAKLYARYNTDLLTNNVRYYLGKKKTKKNTTNADILHTLKEESQKFLAYNNGITALSTEIVSRDDRGMSEFIDTGVLQAVKDFQIVNGGQTTASIFIAKAKSNTRLSDVFVQVKIIVIPQNYENRRHFANSVARSSNTQNTVPYSEFTINDPFNIKIQQLADTIQAPNGTYWFYERILGQYANATERMSAEEAKARFLERHPSSQMFTKEMLAIVQTCWEGLPNDAIKGRLTMYGKFIEREGDKKKPLPDERYFKSTIALLITHRFLKTVNSQYKGTDYIINAYTISYIAFITRGFWVGLYEIWQRQGLSESQEACIQKISGMIHNALRAVIMEMPNEDIVHFAKQKAAFDEIKRRLQYEDIDEMVKQLNS